MTRSANLLTQLGLVAAAVIMSATMGMAKAKQPQETKTEKSVYVCACNKTSSCPCANMSNKAGKCPCGDEMKAVSRDGKWASDNREKLSAAGQ